MASLLLPVLLDTTKPVRVRDAVVRRRMDPKDVEKILVALLSPVAAGLIMVSYAARTSAASTTSCTTSSARPLRTLSALLALLALSALSALGGARLSWRSKAEGIYRR